VRHRSPPGWCRGDADSEHAACHVHQQDWGVPVRIVEGGAWQLTWCCPGGRDGRLSRRIRRVARLPGMIDDSHGLAVNAAGPSRCPVSGRGTSKEWSGTRASWLTARRIRGPRPGAPARPPEHPHAVQPFQPAHRPNGSPTPAAATTVAAHCDPSGTHSGAVRVAGRRRAVPAIAGLPIQPAVPRSTLST